MTDQISKVPAGVKSTAGSITSGSKEINPFERELKRIFVEVSDLHKRECKVKKENYDAN